MFDTKRKSGFTLVELLVVIIIISMLVGLAIPAVMMAQERARRMQCANNLRNLGSAIQEYELSKKQYPGWVNKVGSIPASWPVMILDNIDRADIWDVWRSGTGLGESKIKIATFICPSASGELQGSCPLSYVANCGQADVSSYSPPDWPANGVFFRRYYGAAAGTGTAFSSGDLVDGQQYTLLLSESLQAGNWANFVNNNDDVTDDALIDGTNIADIEITNGMIWWYGGSSGNYNTIAQTLKINRGLDKITGPATDYDQAYPSSYHPGGVNAVFCDGHTQFLSEQMEFKIYAKLMASDDKQVKYAGEDVLMKDPVDSTKGMLQGKLSEDDLK